MKKRNSAGLLAAGVLAGMLIGTPTVQAAAEYLKALPSAAPIYVDGRQMDMEAYSINGNTYVKLRDVGAAVGFNVYWQDGVRIDSTAPYTGESTTGSPAGDAPSAPRAGDIIRCDDGSDYTVTDVSRYDKNMFASGPVGGLPEPACDWDSFPEVEQPEMEARRYRLESGDYLFVRNLHECRRLQYTVMNLAGNHPDTSEDGKLRYGSKGTPYVRIQFGIPDGVTPQKFWPWRESEVERLFNSCPPGTYSLDVWDVYKDGVFQRTEYNIDAF